MSRPEEYVEKVPIYKKDLLDDGRVLKLSVQVDLPGVQSAAELVVNVYPDRIHIRAPGKYKLDLSLQVTIHEKPDLLRFVKKKSQLKAEFIVLEEKVRSKPQQPGSSHEPVGNGSKHPAPQPAQPAQPARPVSATGTMNAGTTASTPPTAPPPSAAASAALAPKAAVPDTLPPSSSSSAVRSTAPAAPTVNRAAADAQPGSSLPNTSAAQATTAQHSRPSVKESIRTSPPVSQPPAASPIPPQAAQSIPQPTRAAHQPPPSTADIAHPQPQGKQKQGGAPARPQANNSKADAKHVQQNVSSVSLGDSQVSNGINARASGDSNPDGSRRGSQDGSLYEYAKASVNQEAAEQWHRRGLAALDAGDAERAAKMFAKADGLWPGRFASDLQNALKAVEQQQMDGSTPMDNGTSGGGDPHHMQQQDTQRGQHTQHSSQEDAPNGTPGSTSAHAAAKDRQASSSEAGSHSQDSASANAAEQEAEQKQQASSTDAGPAPSHGRGNGRAAHQKPVGKGGAAGQKMGPKGATAGEKHAGRGAGTSTGTGQASNHSQRPQEPRPAPSGHGTPDQDAGPDESGQTPPPGNESPGVTPPKAGAAAQRVGGRRRAMPRGSGGKGPGMAGGHSAPHTPRDGHQGGKEAGAKAPAWEAPHEEDLPLMFRLYDSAVASMAWCSLNAGPGLAAARDAIAKGLAETGGWALRVGAWLLDQGSVHALDALKVLLQVLPVVMTYLSPYLRYVEPLLPFVLPGLVRLGVTAAYIGFDCLAVVVQVYPIVLVVCHRPSADAYVLRMQTDVGFSLMVMAFTAIAGLFLAWRLYVFTLLRFLLLGSRWWVQLPVAGAIGFVVRDRYPVAMWALPLQSWLVGGGRRALRGWLLSLLASVVTLGRVPESCLLVTGLMLSSGNGWWKGIITAVSTMLSWLFCLMHFPAVNGKWRPGAEGDGEQHSYFNSTMLDSEFKFGIGPCTVPAGATGEVLRVLKAADFYEVLEVERSIDEEGLRRAKKLKSLATHPDKLGGAAGATEAFRRVTEGYEILADSAKRARYDGELQRASQPRPPPRTASQTASSQDDMTWEDLGVSPKDMVLDMECDVCGKPHLAKFTDIPRTQARHCAACKLSHAAHHGELWFESRGLFGMATPRALLCVQQNVYEVTDWAVCRGYHRAKFVRYDSHDPPYAFTTFDENSPPGGSSRRSSKKKGKRR